MHNKALKASPESTDSANEANTKRVEKLQCVSCISTVATDQIHWIGHICDCNYRVVTIVTNGCACGLVAIGRGNMICCWTSVTDNETSSQPVHMWLISTVSRTQNLKPIRCVLWNFQSVHSPFHLFLFCIDLWHLHKVILIRFACQNDIAYSQILVC